MTSGTRVQDFSVVVNSTTTTFPGGVTTVDGPAWVGRKVTRTWSGGNYPSQKPTYRAIHWRDPRSGEVHTYKQRVDQPVRTKTTPHSYSCTITDFSSVPLVLDISTNGVPSSRRDSTSMYLVGPGVGSASNYWNSNDTIALIGKLQTEVSGSDFNLGVALAESGPALMMIAENATKLYRAIKAVKRGDIVAAGKALATSKRKPIARKNSDFAGKTAADLWVELQYGWKPLLSDIKGGAEFLSNTLNVPVVRTYRVRQKKNLSYPASAGGSKNYADRSGSVSRGQIIARISEKDVAKLSGLLDPLQVAWELLPWSFVADWFMPIGDYLQARNFVRGITGEFVTTIYEVEKCSWRGPQDVHNGTLDSVSKMSNATSTYVYVTRTVSSAISVPFPNFRKLDEVASWSRCANAIALITQQVWGATKSEVAARPPSSRSNTKYKWRDSRYF